MPFVIVKTDKCLYCKKILDSTFHALIGCPFTAELWRQIELWLQTDIDRNIKSSEIETNTYQSLKTLITTMARLD